MATLIKPEAVEMFKIDGSDATVSIPHEFGKLVHQLYVDALRGGYGFNKIAFIRCVRGVYKDSMGLSLSLRDSKDIVDRYAVGSNETGNPDFPEFLKKMYQ